MLLLISLRTAVRYSCLFVSSHCNSIKSKKEALSCRFQALLLVFLSCFIKLHLIFLFTYLLIMFVLQIYCIIPYFVVIVFVLFLVFVAFYWFQDHHLKTLLSFYFLTSFTYERDLLTSFFIEAA